MADHGAHGKHELSAGLKAKLGHAKFKIGMVGPHGLGAARARSPRQPRPLLHRRRRRAFARRSSLWRRSSSGPRPRSLRAGRPGEAGGHREEHGHLRRGRRRPDGTGGPRKPPGRRGGLRPRHRGASGGGSSVLIYGGTSTASRVRGPAPDPLERAAGRGKRVKAIAASAATPAPAADCVEAIDALRDGFAARQIQLKQGCTPTAAE